MDCSQAPLFMGFSRQEYWSGLPFPSPGDLPDPGNELGSPALQADPLLSEPPEKLYKEIDPLICCGGEKEKKKYDHLERQFNNVNQIQDFNLKIHTNFYLFF